MKFIDNIDDSVSITGYFTLYSWNYFKTILLLCRDCNEPWRETFTNIPDIDASWQVNNALRLTDASIHVDPTDGMRRYQCVAPRACSIRDPRKSASNFPSVHYPRALCTAPLPFDSRHLSAPPSGLFRLIVITTCAGRSVPLAPESLFRFILTRSRRSISRSWILLKSGRRPRERESGRWATTHWPFVN